MNNGIIGTPEKVGVNRFCAPNSMFHTSRCYFVFQALKEEDPKAALASFQRVLDLENGEKGEWGFKVSYHFMHSVS